MVKPPKPESGEVPIYEHQTGAVACKPINSASRLYRSNADFNTDRNSHHDTYSYSDACAFANLYADTHHYAYAITDRNSRSYGDSNTYSKSNSDVYTDCYTHKHADSNSDVYAYA